MKAKNEPIDYSQPVAYDTNGRPLYAHPPQSSGVIETNAHPVVHMARPLEPVPLAISPELQEKHNQSKRRYPQLNLSDGEYVISAVRRHPIGLIPIFFVVGAAIIGLSVLTGMYASSYQSVSNQSTMPSVEAITFIAILLGLLFAIGGFMAVYIYTNNKFFLTNESVIQEIQHSLFNKHEQTVSLGNIEDASFRQESFIATVFNYGSIRLSTEGDETTYRFSYVSSPKKHIATLNNAVEAFKNGRPVTDSDN